MYILQSLKNMRYYTGSTSDLKERVEYHNSGRTGYTSKYRPWVLIYFEEFETRKEAVNRERFVKKQKNIKRFLEQHLKKK